jgi:hypothetical protein
MNNEFRDLSASLAIDTLWAQIVDRILGATGTWRLAMDFPKEANKGVFRPEQFNVVKQVFDSVTSEDWFTHSEKRREQFATYLLEAYRNGLTDPFELKTLSRAAARERFSVH